MRGAVASARAVPDRTRDLGAQRAEQAALRGTERRVVPAGRLAQRRLAVDRRRRCPPRQDLPQCVQRALVAELPVERVTSTMTSRSTDVPGVHG